MLAYAANRLLQGRHAKRKIFEMTTQVSQVEDRPHTSAPLQDDKVVAITVCIQSMGGTIAFFTRRLDISLAICSHVPSEQPSKQCH